MALLGLSMVSLGFTSSRLVSLDLCFTWSHLLTQDLTWPRMLSLSLTWFRLVSLGLPQSYLTLSHLIGKAKRWSIQ